MSSNDEISPLMRFVFGRLFPIPFVVIGLNSLFIGARDLQLARASEEWPMAPGVIQNSSIQESHSEYGEGFFVPAWIHRRLFGYQREGLKWMWGLHQQGCGGCLGDEVSTCLRRLSVICCCCDHKMYPS